MRFRAELHGDLCRIYCWLWLAWQHSACMMWKQQTTQRNATRRTPLMWWCRDCWWRCRCTLLGEQIRCCGRGRVCVRSVHQVRWPDWVQIQTSDPVPIQRTQKQGASHGHDTNSTREGDSQQLIGERVWENKKENEPTNPTHSQQIAMPLI
jgi:hypothetical protein